MQPQRQTRIRRFISNSFSGILAGMFIGLGGLAFILAKSTTTSPLLAAALFPIGLFLVCSFNTNLFTGKIGFALTQDKDATTYISPLDYLVMLISNFVGAAIIGLISYFLFRDSIQVIQAAESVASSRLTPPAAPIDIFAPFLKAVVCGALVYAAIYLYRRADSLVSRFIAIFIPIFLFVYLGFNHCVADFFYLSFACSFTPYSFLHLALVIIGNSFGAILLNAFVTRK